MFYISRGKTQTPTDHAHCLSVKSPKHMLYNIKPIAQILNIISIVKYNHNIRSSPKKSFLSPPLTKIWLVDRANNSILSKILFILINKKIIISKTYFFTELLSS